MIDRAKFEFIKDKYGHWTSWAIWAEVGDTPKSNVGDLSIFSGDEFLEQLNPEVVLVGLNISRGNI
jgi:GGDEF domain-containing protein